jgi:hypothetical protein
LWKNQCKAPNDEMASLEMRGIIYAEEETRIAPKVK